MLLPRFSLRWLLVSTAICGVLAYFLARGLAGHAWAIAVAATGASLLLIGVVYAGAFVLAWGVAALGARWRRQQVSSPFAMDRPPPQILPPHEPD